MAVVVKASLRVVDGDHLQGAARRGLGRLEPREVLAERLVLGVGGVVAGRRDDDARRDEAGQAVDVPSGLVVLERRRQPDDLLDAEVLPEDVLGVRPRQPRIAAFV